MKKLIFIVILVLLAAGAFSQINMSAGAQLGFGMLNMGYKGEVDEDNYAQLSQTDTIMGFGAFFDATYVRLALEYAMSIGFSGKTKIVIGGSESEDKYNRSDLDDYSWSMLNILLLGKYPIALGNFTIWPAAGILYSMTLSADFDNDGEADDLSDYDINDLYLSVGAGADIDITSQIYVTITALFHWNLTPNPVKDWEETSGFDETYTGYIINAYVGAGYKF
jgi:hypothetical protein